MNLSWNKICFSLSLLTISIYHTALVSSYYNLVLFFNYSLIFLFVTTMYQFNTFFTILYGGHCGRDLMVVGFTTTYAISAYIHWSCEFESHSIEVYSIQHYVINFVSDLRQVCGFLQALWFPPQYNWNVIEIGVKHHIDITLTLAPQ